MDVATIELLLIGLIGFILIIAVASTADEAKKIRKILTEINQKLDSSGGSFNGQGPVSKSLRPKDDSWVCNCGARNYGSKTCSKCGANKDSR